MVNRFTPSIFIIYLCCCTLLSPLSVNSSSYTLPLPSNPSIPFSSNFTLGASYMSFWGDTLLGWTVPTTHTSLLGEYSSSDPIAADWQVKWAVEHGINFFYLDFGWIRPYDYIDEGARDGLLSCSFISYLNISIFYFPDPVVGSSWSGGESVLYADFDFLAQNYFSHSSYASYNESLIVIFTNFNTYIDEWGTSKTIEVFNNLKANMSTDYGVDLYIVAAFWPQTTQSTVQNFLSVVDSATIWGCDTIIDYSNDITFSDYMVKTKNYFDYWGNLTTNIGIPFVPLIAPGFDNTPYNPSDPWIVYRDIVLFEEMCNYSKIYATTPFELILFFTWNDFHEGTAIEPTVEYGFQYLDVIRKVYTNDSGTHVDEYPDIPLVSEFELVGIIGLFSFVIVLIIVLRVKKKSF